MDEQSNKFNFILLYIERKRIGPMFKLLIIDVCLMVNSTLNVLLMDEQLNKFNFMYVNIYFMYLILKTILF